MDRREFRVHRLQLPRDDLQLRRGFRNASALEFVILLPRLLVKRSRLLRVQAQSLLIEGIGFRLHSPLCAMEQIELRFQLFFEVLQANNI